MTSPGRLAMVPAAILAFGIDLCIIAVVVTIAAIAVTGGGTLHVGSTAISATSVANPVLLLVLLTCGRLLLRNTRPYLLALHGFDLRHAEAGTLGFVDRLGRECGTRRGRFRVLALLIGVSIALRVMNVLIHPGFVTGDDVEIHEMTIGHLLGTHWPIWSLRSPVYPMLFIYPIQALSYASGMKDVMHLVMAGRFIVAAIATLSVWAVYRIAKELTARPDVGCLAAALFALSRLHLWFGSSELPRPVASVFVLAAFIVLLRPSIGRALVAGVLLAAGGSLRFGELAFFAPAAVQLVAERRLKDLALVCVAGVVAAVAIQGAADWLYWGEPFHSWRAAYQYTITERGSSRGFQPAWFYLISAASWTNYVVLTLSLYALVLRDKRAAIWAWIPIALFSLLPHKEARYAIAAQPFVCVAAAQAAHELYRRFTEPTARLSAAAVLVGAIVFAIVLEVGDWQFKRTDVAVRFAKQLDTQRPESIAAQELWRLGGRLYFPDVPSVEELPSDREAAVEVVQQSRFDWVLLRRTVAGAATRHDLEAAGYVATEPSGLEYVVFQKRNATTPPSTDVIR